MDEATGLTCQHCAEAFPLQRTGPRNPKYCSTRCRVAASHERRKTDGRIAAEAKVKREAAAVLRAPCANCSAPVPNARAVYCMAPACRQLAREADLARKRERAKAAYDADPSAGRARVYAMRASWTDEQRQANVEAVKRWAEANRETVACVICGSEFQRPPTHRERQTCSVPCGTELRLRTKGHKRRPVRVLWADRPESDRQATCGSCGVIFIRRRPERAYCSDRCSDRARAQRRIAGRPTFVAGQCRRCGHPFVDVWLSTESSVYCSRKCRDADGRDRRRARKRDAFVAIVRRRDIYERDGWRCHLCGGKVNRKVVVPHPKAPTLDHVIPLARGGTHEPANCRTAHFLCNATKGDRGGGEQLMLIG